MKPANKPTNLSSAGIHIPALLFVSGLVGFSLYIIMFSFS